MSKPEILYLMSKGFQYRGHDGGVCTYEHPDGRVVKINPVPEGDFTKYSIVEKGILNRHHSLEELKKHV